MAAIKKVNKKELQALSKEQLISMVVKNTRSLNQVSKTVDEYIDLYSKMQEDVASFEEITSQEIADLKQAHNEEVELLATTITQLATVVTEACDRTGFHVSKVKETTGEITVLDVRYCNTILLREMQQVLKNNTPEEV